MVKEKSNNSKIELNIPKMSRLLKKQDVNA